MHTRKEQMEAFGRFLDILDELREKCPWDRKQTNESLRPNTIEETYELCDALMRDDKNDICKELGDVLLHVAFYAKIGSETGDFDMKDVCDRLCEKLIFRHPHVFGDVKAETAGQVSENWEQLKLKEKDGNKTVLSGVPAALPSLIKAYRIQDKARNVGFDWEEREQVWDKVKEEIREFQTEVDHMDKEKAEAEFGDVMFSLINAARLYKINPDNALEQTNQKFINRFNYVEAHSIKEGKNLHDMTLEEMDKLWNEAKVLEKKGNKMILLKVSLINKRRLLTSLWQPSLFVFIHYSSFPLRSSLGTISILVHTFQQLTVETHFSPLHQINLFTRQYFLELIKVGLVQPVRSDTGIIYTFHNFLILGFGCFFIFPLSKQLPSLVI